MRQKFEQNWWKFSEYEIKNGYIRPKARAKLIKYDLWKYYRESLKNDDSQRSRPYQSLKNLINNIDTELDDWGHVTQVASPKNKQEIIKWCNEFGLMGILLQQVQMVTLPSTTVGDGYYEGQYKYIRVPDGWESKYHEESKYFPDQESGEEIDVKYDMPAKAIFRELRSYEVKEDNLSRTFGRFFPNVPPDEKETFQYPLPLTEEFWSQYAEPVKDFIEWGAFFSSAVIDRSKPPLIASSLTDPYLLEAFYDDSGYDPKQAVFPVENKDSYSKISDYSTFESSALNWLLSTVTFSLFESNDKNYRRWVAPSLIASFATMAALDSIEGNRVVKCATCGEYFTTSSRTALYCSPTCRHTLQKRRKRERDKQKLETPTKQHEGESLND
jgi:hypothetical protein